MRPKQASRTRARESALIFAALGDETRLQLVARLSREAHLSTTKLSADFSVTRQAITKHLRVMEQAGLLRNTRQGRESVWQLDQQRLQTAGQYLEQISKQWDEALVRLQNFVEE